MCQTLFIKSSKMRIEGRLLDFATWNHWLQHHCPISLPTINKCLLSIHYMPDSELLELTLSFLLCCKCQHVMTDNTVCSFTLHPGERFLGSEDGKRVKKNQIQFHQLSENEHQRINYKYQEGSGRPLIITEIIL